MRNIINNTDNKTRSFVCDKILKIDDDCFGRSAPGDAMQGYGDVRVRGPEAPLPEAPLETHSHASVTQISLIYYLLLSVIFNVP